MNLLVAKTALMISLSFSLASYGRATDEVNSFADIDYWIGEGANSTAIAIDWNGESSFDYALVWGFRWDDAATANDALTGILNDDARLYAKLGTVVGLGTAVVGVGYDENDDGDFHLTDGTVFDESGIAVSSLSDGEASLDEADRYAEGWFLGYWHLGFAEELPESGGQWQSSPTGVDDLTLTDNGWISLAYTTDTFSTDAFAENLHAATEPRLGEFSADFDIDGDVDGTDLLSWQRGFGIAANATLAQGDANADGRVDAMDLEMWSVAYGDSTPPLRSHLVPEATSFWMIISGVLLLFGLSSLSRYHTFWSRI